MAHLNVWLGIEVIHDETDSYEDAGLPHKLLGYEDVDEQDLTALKFQLLSIGLSEDEVEESIGEVRTILEEHNGDSQA